MVLGVLSACLVVLGVLSACLVVLGACRVLSCAQSLTSLYVLSSAAHGVRSQAMSTVWWQGAVTQAHTGPHAIVSGVLNGPETRCQAGGVSRQPSKC
jgi:hypothetical protein